ncbi:hypothetical protein TCON_2101 [Astathelohania contejeani]|uniref:NTF2 domain-containing protein n=1 Tax=Astathelohania contejeani TaxID=164912 RepID=A0ABQ7HWY4_9MICR|nr:hypothetical protein TCON_2101 [Thelohania contejeani]
MNQLISQHSKDLAARFAREYYNNMCRKSSSIAKYYTDASLVSFSRENQSSKSFNSNFQYNIFEFHKKRVTKVLISDLENQEIGPNMLISIIGQYVYEDYSTVRFNHIFFINQISERFVIQNEICRILDEEIIYEDFKSERSSYRSMQTDAEYAGRELVHGEGNRRINGGWIGGHKKPYTKDLRIQYDGRDYKHGMKYKGNNWKGEDDSSRIEQRKTSYNEQSEIKSGNNIQEEKK